MPLYTVRASKIINIIINYRRRRRRNMAGRGCLGSLATLRYLPGSCVWCVVRARYRVSNTPTGVIRLYHVSRQRLPMKHPWLSTYLVLRLPLLTLLSARSWTCLRFRYARPPKPDGPTDRRTESLSPSTDVARVRDDPLFTLHAGTAMATATGTYAWTAIEAGAIAI